MHSVSEDSSIWVSSCFETEKKFKFSKLRTESSQRDYFRFNSERDSFILMYAPKGIDESIDAFCEKAEIFKSNGVKVPEIYFRNDELGHLIIEDFSDNLFQFNIDHSNASKLIKSAIDQINCIQSINPDEGIFKKFDIKKAIGNKELFIEFYCKGHLGLQSKNIPYQDINEGYDFIMDKFYDMPMCISHYDFETRNLIYLASSETGVLDFQDAMVAPYALDLASIIKDLYMVWNEDQINDWLNYYLENNSNIEVSSIEQLKDDVEICAMQRQIRILGKLSQVSITLKRKDRLKDFPRLINYLIESMSSYKELEGFSKFIQKQK